jgi:hypothetical protein
MCQHGSLRDAGMSVAGHVSRVARGAVLLRCGFGSEGGTGCRADAVWCSQRTALHCSRTVTAQAATAGMGAESVAAHAYAFADDVAHHAFSAYSWADLQPTAATVVPPERSEPASAPAMRAGGCHTGSLGAMGAVIQEACATVLEKPEAQQRGQRACTNLSATMSARTAL